MRTFIHDPLSADVLAELIPGVTVTEVEHTPAGLALTAFVPTASAPCPHCGAPSSRVHSYYTR